MWSNLLCVEEEESVINYKVITMKQSQNSLPEWYWELGLHDAKILACTELQLVPDYKDETLKYNCFEIVLNCESAIYEYNIEKICLYNYKIKSNEFDVSELNGGWWLSDEIESKGDQYLLRLEFDTAKCKTKQVEIAFQYVDVVRDFGLVR